MMELIGKSMEKEARGVLGDRVDWEASGRGKQGVGEKDKDVMGRGQLFQEEGENQEME